MATPRSTAAAQVRLIVTGAPAWKPQATLALVTMSSSAMSSPSRQMPKPSPRSALRSITMVPSWRHRLPGRDEQRLGSAADLAGLVVQRRPGQAPAGRTDHGGRIEADPLANGCPEKRDRQVHIHEHVGLEVEGEADAVAAVGEKGQAFHGR